MSRPSREPIDASETGWVGRINGMFEDLLDGPFPIGIFADLATLTSAYNPKKHEDCFAIIDTVLYKSSDTAWEAYREQLSHIADLDTGTATVSEIRAAYNGLLADMRSKGWMV